MLVPNTPNKQPTGGFKRAPSAFLKKYSQIIYAIILMVLIPATIIGNSIFIIKKFQTTIDYQLHRQALLIAEVFDATAFQSLDDAPEAQKAIERMLATNDQELRSFDIIVPRDSTFTIVASSFPANVGKAVASPNVVLAWNTDEGIANLSEPTPEDTARDPELRDQRYWNVVFPLHDLDEKKIALLNLKMSVKVTDELTSQTLLGSGLILVLTLIIIVALLLINTRLFEFAILFNKLKEVDQMKDEFISMASHELRTPITAIKGYVSMFIDGSFGVITEQGKKGFAIIESSIRRLADLVEDLLDVSRIEQSRLQVNLAPVDLHEVITTTLDELQINAQSKHIALSFPTPKEKIPLVLADKDKLRQVLVNLVGNAIKYTKQGSVLVTAQTQDTGSSAIVKIKDTGVGMSAQERQNLFTKFYRVQNETTKGIIGTGLGLWITKQLVNLMGGEIFVDSIVGTGTEFSFTIPVSKAPLPQEKESGARAT